MITEIATADRERLKAYSDYLISQLTLQHGQNPDIEALKQVLRRYDILTLIEPTTLVENLTLERMDYGQSR